MDTSWIVEAAQSYDRVAVPYVAVVRDGLNHLPFESSLVNYFVEQVKATGGGLVIDLGCGPGLLSRYLASLGLSVLGVDVSPEMLRIAGGYNPGQRFIEASLTEVPVPDGSAAGVFCWYVMHHVPDEDLGQSFAEIARVLRPGGQLMIGGHVGDSAYVKTEGYGGLPMNVLFARRSITAYAELVRGASLVVDATIDLGPAQPSVAAIRLAHKTL
ncbi:methyltransferase family protein [Humibacillus xanthopallidus]|uniref:Methyltransferase family protein n=1 Tax=Humibacillus xanthopallidus TaxID=412689 RepID=A0A543PX11_9MICO|nr:class I SAM-dependent methyltransferase [Humibacillus xanthopallidus]TQN48596.1 methyltransferase family protein [Humibacillus xanthopallidus]